MNKNKRIAVISKKLIFVILFTIYFTINSYSQQNTENISKLSNQLIHNGWHRKEIDRLMQFYMEDNSGILSSKDKEFTPMPLPNTLREVELSHFNNWLDSYLKEYKLFSKNFKNYADTYKIKYAENVEPYKPIQREIGLWKHVKMNPTAGRIYDLELHPENSDVIYANPDGDGIFKTVDGGYNWESITDNIPDRLNRNSYENIIVDPSDFDHVFSISRFGKMFETKNGGQSWVQIVNTKHNKGLAPQFKWVESLRNSVNELVIIGSVTKNNGLNKGWRKGVYRSSDAGLTWIKLDIIGTGFQELAFHKTNFNIVYLANTSELYKSTNYGSSFKLVKDFKNGNRPMFISTLGRDEADGLYVAISQNNETQIYLSTNQGETWELKQDSEKKIGYDEGVFGKNGSGGWTSFFSVDPFNSKHLIASNVSTCESFDGGVNWEFQNWGKRANAQIAKNIIVPSPYASHNADNHVLKFHPLMEGLMVKGCDAGIMKKENGDTNWTNINGSMPAFLWYSVVVNDFGDRYLAGNTQDVNIQTNRYNQWENERGYEGDVIFMNPSTNTTYFPTAKTEKGEGLNFLEPGFWKMHSWSYPKVAVNYKNLDQLFIAYARRPAEPEPQLPKFLYVSNNRGVTFDRVPNMDDKEVFSVNVSRTAIQVLTAFTATDVMQSTDFGKTWTVNNYPENIKGRNNKRRISGSVNPQNPNQLWVGGNEGTIYSSNNGGETWTSIGDKLPKGDVIELLFHEGTNGDLYALIKGFGVFFLNEDSSDWVLWMKGFNLVDFTEIRIDYPTQKLLASSYGRGLWQSDLEKQAERFLNRELKIASKGKINRKYVFNIDTDLVIPSYYKYTWYRNEEKIGNDSQTLIVDKAKKGDVIKVEISPIYSIDVKTSASIVLTGIYKRNKVKENSDFVELDNSYINAGYIDLFGPNKNFTISTWIKPDSIGVIAANRRSYYRDAKGWFLEINSDGMLHFNAAFYQNRSLNKTYGKGDDQSISVVSREKVKLNKWQHIAISVNREKTIKLFIDGELVGFEDISNVPSYLALNSVMDLTLMADSYRKRNLNGSLRNFSIHGKELSKKQLMRIIDKGSVQSDELELFIFKSDGGIEELYSAEKMKFINLK